MNNNSMFITDEQMQELTGYQKPSKQCKVLEEAGIFFIKRPDGRPKTTWEHFNISIFLFINQYITFILRT